MNRPLTVFTPLQVYLCLHPLHPLQGCKAVRAVKGVLEKATRFFCRIFNARVWALGKIQRLCDEREKGGDNAMMKRDYYETKTEMSDGLGIPRSTLYRWIKRNGFPKQTRRGWSKEAVHEFARDALAKAVKAQTGPNADLKADKLRREIRRLDELVGYDRERRKQAEIETAKRRGELVTSDEVKRTLAELCAAFRHGLNRLVEITMAEASDAKEVERAERVRDDTLKAVQAAITDDD